MRTNRRFLYPGLFLIAVGGVLVAADVGAVHTATLTDMLRLWPLAVVAVGLGIALRQTHISLPSGMLAAAVPGLVLGGAFAVAPRFAGDCGARAAPSTVVTEQNSFDGPATVFSVVVNAGRGQIALPGARIERLAVTANASEIVVDASGAAISELSGVVNVGLLSVHLPANGDLVGSLRVGGGELQVCSPPGLGMRLTSRGSPRQVTVDGLQQSGSEWQSPDYGSASHRADLQITVHFGAVKINPTGGCR